jgi:quinol monooxygenase YgiN
MVPAALEAITKDREDAVIYVVATLTVKPEMRAEFIAGAIACIKETRKEPGNIAYDLHESVTDHTKMVFVEQWENAEALVPHRAAEHMKAFGRIAVQCISAPPRIEVIAPAKVDVR